MNYDSWRWEGLDDSRPFTREERETYNNEDHRDSNEFLKELFSVLHCSYLGSRIDYYNLFKTMDEIEKYFDIFSEEKMYEIYEKVLEDEYSFYFINSEYNEVELIYEIYSEKRKIKYLITA